MGRHDKAVKLIGMEGKHVFEACDCDGKRRRWSKSQQDHTSMRLVLHEYQIAKIEIVRDQDPVLAIGDPENIYVCQAGGVLARNCRNVMT